ncbi:hypothetical protein [Sneathiella glossodoripedis]|uniref:hypothetical protein n=1 Tax=Sneathiella glossodoripedis TaxID=418853 RepID=UPI00046FBB0D|nr:hypothetical protein [Sneathiella glossodoripedis]
MKHTPGPWKAAEQGDYGDFDGNSRVILGDDRRIAVVQHSGTDEDEANAHLIEASPDLLEALKHARLMIMNSGIDTTGTAVPMYDAAISKAEGKS